MDDRDLAPARSRRLPARVDDAGFRRAYNAYFGRIYRFCFRRTLDVEAAESLTSDIFLRAQRRLWSFPLQGVTMGAWFFRLALDAVERHRRRRAGPRGGGRLRDALLCGRQMQLAGLMEQNLDDVTREVVRLHYWDGLRHGEIGVVLGIPVDAVQRRLARGREELAYGLQLRHPDREVVDWLLRSLDCPGQSLPRDLPPGREKDTP